MNKLSNAALQAKNDVLHAENDVLRREAQEHEATLAEAAVAIANLEARLAQATQAYMALAAKQPKPKAALPEHMAKARALAMSSGKTVLA